MPVVENEIAGFVNSFIRLSLWLSWKVSERLLWKLKSKTD